MSYSWGDDSSSSWSGGGFDYGSSKKSYVNDKSYLSSSGRQSMDKAYQLTSKLLDKVLTDEDRKLLKTLTKNDISVVRGQFDHVEKILDACKIPYTLVGSNHKLETNKVVLVNCPGNEIGNVKYKRQRGNKALAEFVTEGGFAVTTDWALKDVVEQAFPGIVKHNGVTTGDDVVEVDLVASQSPYTKGLGEGSLKPLWWLESASYPITVVNDKGLDILLGSQEMKSKYKDDAVLIKFPYGDGRVLHATSHFNLQTVKSKYAGQDKNTAREFSQRFLGLDEDDIKGMRNINQVSFGAMETAYTSVRFLTNVFLQKLRTYGK